MGKHEPEPKLTAGEKAKVTYYVARMCKRSIAGEDVHQADLKRKVDRVIENARKRGTKNRSK
ncbi:hypothetical protein E2C00_27575 [Streptomyces sp. WAC05374]|uniref:DUF6257 family protein n=1 Tax=Streptomyces sp. WAC05374 TaxID=2487420 RepID=UPI000F88A18E|nr:DUF6257 family protein [Streptomyces sp. WAC05374]RST18542.1 hypothetical protein EF905_04860 [Streptomyces sp. WAC05374]TDF43278.1 hypothetical protein E2B92_20430 [Streptomyces sp. WAC05374]TDF51064.1 hypothetical protein E2C00_27575 [Streptomyces sp. WAC05374]TDF52193.1 hypothetical protein E2C02_21590 [Streptomyces sp. WAC05374]